MNTFLFSIITPSGKVFDENIESLTLPAMGGSLGILAGHAPIVAAIESGVLKVIKGSIEHYYAISAGTLEVNRDGTIFLADYAIERKSLQEAKSYNPN